MHKIVVGIHVLRVLSNFSTLFSFTIRLKTLPLKEDDFFLYDFFLIVNPTEIEATLNLKIVKRTEVDRFFSLRGKLQFCLDTQPNEKFLDLETVCATGNIARSCSISVNDWTFHTQTQWENQDSSQQTILETSEFCTRQRKLGYILVPTRAQMYISMLNNTDALQSGKTNIRRPSAKGFSVLLWIAFVIY